LNLLEKKEKKVVVGVLKKKMLVGIVVKKDIGEMNVDIHQEEDQMILLLQVLVLLLINDELVAAQLRVDHPLSRGYNQTTNSQQPCGGFATPSANRVNFAISGATVSFTVLSQHGLVTIGYGVGNNPTTFVQVSGNDFKVDAAIGAYNSEPIDLTTAGATVGSVGSLQLVYGAVFSNDTFQANFYQCLDVTIIEASIAGSSSSATPQVVFNSFQLLLFCLLVVFTLFFSQRV